MERLIVTQNNPHHWLQTDIIKIPIFLYHYFKDIIINEQTISQTKLISLFLRKNFRFNYQLLWSEQDQPAFAAFHNHFTTDECLPFIIKEQNEHPYFFEPETITKQAVDCISFDPRFITENNLHDDNRPYRYKIFKKNKMYLPIITMMKTTLIMKSVCLKTKMKIVMKIWHSIQMKRMQVSIPPSPKEVVQDRTQKITSIRDNSVNVLSPTRIISNST